MVRTSTNIGHVRDNVLVFWLRRQSVALIIAFLLLATTGFLKWQSQWMPENIQVPMPKVPSLNARDFYIKAEELLRDKNAVAFALTNEPPRNPHGVPASAVADWNVGYHHFTMKDKEYLVHENAPALAKLREGMRYPYLNSEVRPLFYPYVVHDRAMARLLLLEGHNKAATGDWGGAESSYLDILKFGSDLPRGLGILGALVGMAVQDMGRSPMSDVMPHLDLGQTERTLRRLQQFDASQMTAKEMLQNARWGTQGALLDTFHRPQWRQEFIRLNSPGQVTDKYQPVNLLIRLESPRTAYDNYSHYMDRLIAQSGLSWPELRQAKRLTVPKDPVNQILLPDLSNIWFRVFTNTAHNHLLETQLALRVYKLKHGTYPNTLAALAPKYLSSITDPFSDDQPLRYRRKGVGYLLYSIGPDTKDEGGIPIISKDETGKTSHYLDNPDTSGDVVAGVNN